MKTTFENSSSELYFSDLVTGDIFTAPSNYPKDMVLMVLEDRTAVILSEGATGTICPMDDGEAVNLLEGTLKVRFV